MEQFVFEIDKTEIMKQFIVENWLVIILFLGVTFIVSIALLRENRINERKREKDREIRKFFIDLQSTENLEYLSAEIRTGLMNVEKLCCRGEDIPKEIIHISDNRDLYRRIANIIDMSIRKRKHI